MKLLKVAVIASTLVLAACSNVQVLGMRTADWGKVTLFNTPCTNKLVIEAIKSMGGKAYIPQMQAGIVEFSKESSFKGEKHDLCFLGKPGGEDVLIVDDMGNIGPLGLDAPLKDTPKK